MLGELCSRSTSSGRVENDTSAVSSSLSVAIRCSRHEVVSGLPRTFIVLAVLPETMLINFY